MTELSPASWPREGYLPEWLALEDVSGGRYQMVGDFSIDCPTYNAIFSAMSKQWPQHEDELEVWDEATDESCKNTTVRIYKPRVVTTDKMPLMIFFHGGGFVTGNLDTEDAHCRYFAAKMPCLVISVDYAKVVDPKVNLDVVVGQYGVPAVAWGRKRASELGADSSKTVLCGGSAGAMLSAQIAYPNCIEKRDEGSIAGLLLFFGCFFPYTYGENGKYKGEYKSWNEHGRGKVPIIHEDLAKFIWTHYDADFDSPRHFPGLADDLSNWPPTYLVSAEKDLFRDDPKIFQTVLNENGVRNRLDYYEGLPHWFHAFPALDMAHVMMAKSINGLKFVLDDRVADANNMID